MEIQGRALAWLWFNAAPVFDPALDPAPAPAPAVPPCPCPCPMPLQSHPFFEGIHWDRLYQCPAPYVPTVEHQLDTQNFEPFEEEEASAPKVRGNVVGMCACVWVRVGVCVSVCVLCV